MGALKKKNWKRRVKEKGEEMFEICRHHWTSRLAIQNVVQGMYANVASFTQRTYSGWKCRRRFRGWSPKDIYLRGRKREATTPGGQGQPERQEGSQGDQPPRDRLVKATSVELASNPGSATY